MPPSISWSSPSLIYHLRPPPQSSNLFSISTASGSAPIPVLRTPLAADLLGTRPSTHALLFLRPRILEFALTTYPRTTAYAACVVDGRTTRSPHRSPR